MNTKVWFSIFFSILSIVQLFLSFYFPSKCPYNLHLYSLCMINLVRRSDFLVLSKILFLLLFQHIVHSMKDPSIAAFWLFTLPEVAGGFEYDDDVKKKVWWQYKVSFFLLLLCETCSSLFVLIQALLPANVSGILSKRLKLQRIPSTEVLSRKV